MSSSCFFNLLISSSLFCNSRFACSRVTAAFYPALLSHLAYVRYCDYNARMETKNLPHDAAYKDFFSHPEMVISLLRDFFSAQPFVQDLDYSTLERLSGEYVGKDFTRSFSDMVWRAHRKNRNWCYVALLLEFQSRPDRLMPIRLMSYTAQLLLRLAKENPTLAHTPFPSVFPIVLYNGRRPWRVHRNVIDYFSPASEAERALLPQQGYLLFDELHTDVSEAWRRFSLLARLARFNQARSAADTEMALKGLREAVPETKYPELHRTCVSWVIQRFRRSGVPGDWERHLNNLEEVHDMLTLDMGLWKAELSAEGMAKGRAEGMAKGRAEGMAEGRAEGMAKGRAEGELQARREVLREILANKFAETLPQSVTDYLAGETNLKRLRSLTVAASCLNSAEDFAARVEELRREADQAN